MVDLAHLHVSLVLLLCDVRVSFQHLSIELIIRLDGDREFQAGSLCSRQPTTFHYRNFHFARMQHQLPRIITAVLMHELAEDKCDVYAPEASII